MRLTRIHSRILRLPASRSLPLAGRVEPAATPPVVLVVQLDTDGGLSGLGFGIYPGGGSALQAAAEGDLKAMLAGEDLRHHERLWAKSRALGCASARAAYAAVDIALWDLKGKAAQMPLWKLLGGASESARCFTAETAVPGLSAAEIIQLARTAQAQGIGGLRVALAGLDPKADSDLLVTVHDAVGEDVWYAVTMDRPYDFETALPVGRFIEEEIGADWFENPLPDDDVAGYAALAAKLDTPLAQGGRLDDASQFTRLATGPTRTILRPHVIRVGGITPWLKIAVLAEANRRTVVANLLPEVSVHLACGLPAIGAVEYVSTLSSFFTPSPRLDGGRLIPPLGPGLGLELLEKGSG